MDIVAIKEGIMMIENVKKSTVHLDFLWKQASCLKYFGPLRRRCTRSFD